MLSGREALTERGAPIGPTVLDFWRWAASDLLSNALRGQLAEFIVGAALGCAGRQRLEWDAYDLETDDGIKVEVKSAAYIQSWPQERPSRLSFGIRPTNGWDAKTNTWPLKSGRHADVYVFCVFAHSDRATADPLDLDQWEFYVVSTRVLNERCPSQKTLSLSSLLKLKPEKVAYAGLADVIRNAAASAVHRKA